MVFDVCRATDNPYVLCPNGPHIPEQDREAAGVGGSVVLDRWCVGWWRPYLVVRGWLLYISGLKLCCGSSASAGMSDKSPETAAGRKSADDEQHLVDGAIVIPVGIKVGLQRKKDKPHKENPDCRSDNRSYKATQQHDWIIFLAGL